LKRTWIGLALLSASWLFGLSYYHDANWWAWAILVAAGTGLLTAVHIRTPTATQSLTAALMLLPPIVLAPWPYRMAPLLIFVGLVLGALPIPRRWPGILASALILGGVILTAQSLAILGYQYLTARSHELPWPLPSLLYTILRLLGVQAALDGTSISLYSPRAVHRLGATWELLLDLPTLAFLFGGIVMLCLWIPEKNLKLKTQKSKLAALVILIAAWLLVRAAVLMSIFMHRALRTEYEAELVLMNQFWNPWLHLAFLLGPILLSLRFVRTPSCGQPPRLPAREDVGASEPGAGLADSTVKRLGAIILTFAGTFCLITGLLLDVPGQRKQGRVIVDEYHSTWEPTDRPFDVNWYGHDSGYNYACIYDYCSRFYEMSRLKTPIDDTAVRDCDVLMVKVPTSRYDPQEVAAIGRFVEKGGGLLLIGEHTNVFNTGTHINDIARIFGFSFRYDCLFDIDTIYTQLYRPPLVPHPIVQSMPPFNFAVSCSINPGRSPPAQSLVRRAGLGRAVILATGLKSLPADYHASNFYPQVEDRADVRYGAFVQLWAANYGSGRVVAFTDSTVFSNFATFEPGKAELMLGMLEWLNYRNCPYPLRPLLILLGLLLFAGGLVLCRIRRLTTENAENAEMKEIQKAPFSACSANSAVIWSAAWLLVVSAGLFGWALAAAGTRAIHRYSMPLPEAARPMVRVVVDRTVCDAPLSGGGFIAGKKEGFGIFERWILRLGYFTSRRRGTDALTGELIVFTHPNRTVPREFRDDLVNYVAAGGKVLVLDSPANVESTANSLLYPFGLTVNPSPNLKGLLKAPENWPVIRIDSTCQIEGGEPIMWVANRPIAATVRHGKGTVTVIGFGSRFADAYMGVTGDVVPGDEMRKVYDLQFVLLRAILSTSFN